MSSIRSHEKIDDDYEDGPYFAENEVPIKNYCPVTVSGAALSHHGDVTEKSYYKAPATFKTYTYWPKRP